jgi:replicative DNA helicase
MKFFLSRGNYEAYGGFVDKEFLKQSSPELLKIFNALEVMHGLGIANPTILDLEAALYAAYPKLDASVYQAILSGIASQEIDPKSCVLYLRELEKRELAAQLAYASLDYAEGRRSFDEIHAISEKLNTIGDLSNEKEDKEEFVNDDIEVLYNHAVAQPGLQWRLQTLRRSLGPLRNGDFGFIFARPETGKTTFLASEVSWMAGQTDRPVLWINNEEQGEKVLLRCYEACLGAPLEKIIANKQRARELFYERTKRNIKVKDAAASDRKGIELLCRKYKPSLIVVDQLDKVRGFSANREDLLLGAIYQWARELAKEFAPVIGVSQADGSGEGIKYLTMGNVANAKTAKQAEADWILGIGVSYEDHPNVRGFSICKNKLIGGEETVAAKRHGKFDVLIEPELGRYKDIQG